MAPSEHSSLQDCPSPNEQAGIALELGVADVDTDGVAEELDVADGVGVGVLLGVVDEVGVGVTLDDADEVGVGVADGTGQQRCFAGQLKFSREETPYGQSSYEHVCP